MNLTQLASSLALGAIATASTALGGCIITTDDSDFIIDNQSDYALYEAYLAEVGTVTWGPNLLGGDVLLPGEQLEVFDVACGTYDALIVDEFNAQCTLTGIDLCFDDAYWVIDNFSLASCPF